MKHFSGFRNKRNFSALAQKAASTVMADGGDLISFPVVLVSEWSRGTHFSENRNEENESLDHIVCPSKASFPVENDDICLAMLSSCSLLDLDAGVGVVAKKLGQLDAGVDDLGGPSMSTYILEKKVAAMRGATCGQYQWE